MWAKNVHCILCSDLVLQLFHKDDNYSQISSNQSPTRMGYLDWFLGQCSWNIPKSKQKVMIDPSQQGGVHGLARFSVAKQPKPSVKVYISLWKPILAQRFMSRIRQAMIPAMGLKFLRDKTDSANLLAMESVRNRFAKS